MAQRNWSMDMSVQAKHSFFFECLIIRRGSVITSQYLKVTCAIRLNEIRFRWAKSIAFGRHLTNACVHASGAGDTASGPKLSSRIRKIAWEEKSKSRKRPKERGQPVILLNEEKFLDIGSAEQCIYFIKLDIGFVKAVVLSSHMRIAPARLLCCKRVDLALEAEDPLITWADYFALSLSCGV